MLGKRSRLAPSLPLVFLILAGCGDNAKTPSAEAPPEPVAVACDVHATTGAAKFVQRSEAWGLSTAKVVGNRLTSADINGDGFPDLLVHAIGSNNREVIGKGPRLVYVLMNEPSPNGGRTFVDRTTESGYAKAPDSMTEYRSAQSAVFADVDNDGDLDALSIVYTAYDKVATPPTAADLDRTTLMLNDGTGHFTAAAQSGLYSDKPKPTTGATFVDIDHNGFVDIFLGFFYTSTTSPQNLLAGHGDGTFTDISASSGVTSSATRRAAYGVTSCDVNNDGMSELLVSAYARGPNVLYTTDKPGHYADVGAAAKFAYDDNQTYTDNQMFACYCTLHPDQVDCMGVGTPLIQCPMPADAYWNPVADVKAARLGGNTFTTVCSDITGDGKLDLYNAEIAHWWAGQSSDRSELLKNTSDGASITFERPGQTATGLMWEHPTTDWNEGGIVAASADLDNDGREDILVGASDYPDQFNLYFHQKVDGTFEEIGTAQGLHHPCTSGMTVADFDRDGDLDVIVGSGTARDCAQIWSSNEVHFYENDANQYGHWLGIKLVGDGVSTNRAGIGARVTVDAHGTKLVRELGGGYGHMGMQDDTIVFFGIGGCEILHAIEVTWPNGTRSVERFENVVADRFVELRQGDPKVHDVATTKNQ
jgi:hypothetical protein